MWLSVSNESLLVGAWLRHSGRAGQVNSFPVDGLKGVEFSVPLMQKRLAKAQRARKRLLCSLSQDGGPLQVLFSVTPCWVQPHMSLRAALVQQVRATCHSHHLLPYLSKCQVRLVSCPPPPCRPPVGCVRTLWLVALLSEWHAPPTGQLQPWLSFLFAAAPSLLSLSC